MKSVTMLKLSEMESVEIEFISSANRVGNQIVIELIDNRPLSEIAEQFEDRPEVVRTDSIRPEISTTYTGYTELIDIRRNQADGSVRLTLKKP